MKKYKYYIASGWEFGKADGEMIRAIKVAAERLRAEVGHDAVFVPMEHDLPAGDTLDNETWSRGIFAIDLEALRDSETVYYLDWGAEGDVGAGWEVGYAYASHIPVICESRGKDVSLMIAHSITSFSPHGKGSADGKKRM